MRSSHLRAATVKRGIADLCARQAVKFEIYHGGAAHPLRGDEARERAKFQRDARLPFEEETRPNTAILALRHPGLRTDRLEDLQHIYASKVREGAPVAIVQDDEGVFVRTKLLQKRGDTLLVEGWSKRGEDAVRAVPDKDVFGGWPAMSLLLSHPTCKLKSEIEFLWPSTISSSVVVKQGGAELDPNVGLGSLLRNSKNLSISIDGVDYPLEHDKAASHAGTRAAKERQRRVLVKVMWSQAGGCLLLSAVWLLLEWQISKLRKAEALDVDEVIKAQKLRLQRQAGQDRFCPEQRVEEDGWGAVQLGWAEPEAEPWSPAKDLPGAADEPEMP